MSDQAENYRSNTGEVAIVEDDRSLKSFTPQALCKTASNETEISYNNDSNSKRGNAQIRTSFSLTNPLADLEVRSDELVTDSSSSVNQDQLNCSTTPCETYLSTEGKAMASESGANFKELESGTAEGVELGKSVSRKDDDHEKSLELEGKSEAEAVTRETNQEINSARKETSQPDEASEIVFARNGLGKEINEVDCQEDENSFKKPGNTEEQTCVDRHADSNKGTDVERQEIKREEGTGVERDEEWKEEQTCVDRHEDGNKGTDDERQKLEMEEEAGVEKEENGNNWKTDVEIQEGLQEVESAVQRHEDEKKEETCAEEEETESEAPTEVGKQQDLKEEASVGRQGERKGEEPCVEGPGDEMKEETCAEEEVNENKTQTEVEIQEDLKEEASVGRQGDRKGEESCVEGPGDEIKEETCAEENGNDAPTDVEIQEDLKEEASVWLLR